MIWQASNRFDPRAVEIADRHYSRQKPGTPQFVAPGRNVVLFTPGAVWATTWPIYAMHEWRGAWMNTTFRNESQHKASDLILQAVACTRWKFGEPPALGMITMIDTKKVKLTMRRGVKTWGYCYIKAGFSEIGKTKGGLLVFQLLPENMPEAEPPVNAQLRMFDVR